MVSLHRVERCCLTSLRAFGSSPPPRRARLLPACSSWHSQHHRSLSSHDTVANTTCSQTCQDFTMLFQLVCCVRRLGSVVHGAVKALVDNRA
eukprot:3120113-Rhodomonas_salina.1